jgi:periplasmic protein TonB
MMKKRPTLRTFVLLSVLIHLLIAISHMLYPKVPPPVEKKEPIKVKFQAPKKPEIPAFIETSKPKKIESPKNSELVSKYNSVAHSPAKIHNTPKQKSRKTTIPKLVPRKPTPIPVPSQKPKLAKKPKKVIKKTPKPPKKEVNKKNPKTPEKKISTKRKIKAPEKKIKAKREIKTSEPKPKLKIANKLIEPTFEPSQQPRQQIKSPELPQSQSLLAMIDGIDPEKYASIETDEDEDSADEEEVSLNTTEIKYADYMARIKHQIEKVWTYPEQAARKGISGEITLRFKLSKDGNLLSVRMLDSSGTKILDVAAIKAVKGAAPYYPFPATITTKKLVITASFIYSPSYGNPYAYR